MKLVLVALFLIFSFAGSAQKFVPEPKKKKSKASTYHLKMLPPGVVELENGLMIDETEITNFQWMEYIYWTNRVFGKDSAKHLDVLIDSTVWTNTNYCLHDYDTYYLSHPVYRDYPVVGITQEQALLYCKWRSDRVFEYILIRDKKMDYHPDQNTENYFTIEAYFAGQYFDYVPDTNYKFVPRYWLPSVEEWNYAVEQNDLLECNFLSRSNKKAYKDCWSNTFINTDNAPCDTGDIKDITVAVSSACTKKRLPNYIYNLRGNVHEWVIEKDTCIGGGWNDSKKMIYEQSVIKQTKQSANTGFRCVCVWEKVPNHH